MWAIQCSVLKQQRMASTQFVLTDGRWWIIAGNWWLENTRERHTHTHTRRERETETLH